MGSSWVWLAWDLKGNRTARAKSTGCPQSKEGLRNGENTQLAGERILRPNGPSHHGNPKCFLRCTASSYHLENGWRDSPSQKEKPVVNIQKEFRPISLTPCISKVAEEFVVDGFVKPAVMKILNDNQYGAIPNSSTIMVLISILYSWSLNTHGNGATVRTLLLDYRKAFDLIDHSILVRKLRNQCKLPASINNWIIDFLSDRSQHHRIRVFLWMGPSLHRHTTGYQTRPMVIRLND